MRQAGTLDSETDAQRFVDYLLSLGITAKVDRSGEAWAVWIHDENQVDRSKQELELFRQAPQDARYRDAVREAQVVRREIAQKQKQARKNYVEVRNLWASPWRRRPVTVAMIAISVVLAFAEDVLPVDYLMFWMPAIQQGQVWRLITPIFLHGGLLHLLFNMWWMYDLGTLVETQLRTLRYVALLLVIALVSNVSQYVASGPYFLGMSGVVYGLFGYAWVRGRLDPTCGLYLRPDIAIWMMGWFVLCLVSPQMNVANTAHGAGLACGAALGYLAFTIGQLRRR
jgi:GlpG protein